VTSEQTQIPREIANLKAVKTVGLISDTHVPVRANRIPRMVFKVFENVDFIVHAGDLVSLAVIDELEQLAPVFGGSRQHGCHKSAVLCLRLTL